MSKQAMKTQKQKHTYDTNVETSEIDPVLLSVLNGKYTIEKVIGQGAQGKIYRGKCLADGKAVAIKQLRVTSTKDWKQYELFSREAKVLESLNLPGTAKFYQAIQDLEGPNPISVIIQEYIQGKSLQSYIDNGNRFLFEHVCQILIKILKVIRSLHEHNPQVIHRDIKPSNIILCYSDNASEVIPEVYIVDFGAVANPQVQDGGSTVTGTYGYMAPEQLIGKPTAASDIYSFAVMAVYLLSGVPPENIATQDLRLLIDPHLEHLPHEVTVFLRLMLETAPTQRLMDYDKIQSTLEMFSKHQFKIDYLLKSDKNNPKSDLKYTLQHVQSIGQPGNFALWQNLPEKTPRKIDKTYKNTLKVDDLYLYKKAIDTHQAYVYNPKKPSYQEINTKNISLLNLDVYRLKIPLANRSLYQERDKIEKKIQKNKKTAYFAILFECVAILTVVICAILLFTSQNYNSIVLILCLSTLPTIIIYMAVFIFMSLSHVKKIRMSHLISLVLRDGRKSIATVVSVEFISRGNEFNKVLNTQIKLSNTNNSVGQLNQSIHLMNNNIRPIWKVTYAFNPPDDESPNALHHVYYSDVPLTHLKPGDALPILYLIVHQTDYAKYKFDFTQKEMVLSLPYPIPKDSSFLQCNNLFTSNSARSEICVNSEF